MNNFGIKQIGFHQTGTVKGGLQPQQYSGTWGDRGQGNELQSALENGLSWVGDKVVNFWDYLDKGFDKGVSFIFGESQPTERQLLVEQLTNNPNVTLVDSYGNETPYSANVINTGVVPVLPKLVKNPTDEMLRAYNNMKRLRISWMNGERYSGADLPSSSKTVQRYNEWKKIYDDAVKIEQNNFKKVGEKVRLTKKQDASFKRNKAAATNDGRANNQGRPRVRGLQWKEVEKDLYKDQSSFAEKLKKSYAKKESKGTMDEKQLRQAKKEMLWKYINSRNGYDYLKKNYE